MAKAIQINGLTKVYKSRLVKTKVVAVDDLHLEVDPELPVREAHRISHLVKDSVMAGCREVADVLVHVEPGIDRSAAIR